MRQSSLHAQPSTIRGIKRRAKAIAKQAQLTHLDALDLAARMAGFENFKNAERGIRRAENAPALIQQQTYSIYLSAYWRDISTRPVQAGLETIRIELPRPLHAFLQRHQVGRARNLHGFFLESPDHLELRANEESQQRAREHLRMAALTLQFAEATGLRPATNQRQWNLMNGLHHLPNNDHDSGWVSESGDWVHLDEPYDSAKRPSELQRRETWLADRGQHGAWIAWGGLYSPDQTRPHLTTANPSLLHQLKLTLEALPPVISGDWPHWPWVSGDYWAQFISPSRSAAGGKRKPRAGTTYGWSKNAIEYRSSVGFKSLWRPDRPMSLANHKLLGDELKNLGVSPTTNAGHSKLQRVRSELENWLFAEYPRDTSASATATFDVYYGGQATKRYRSPQEQLAALDRIQSVLIASYPESKPLRDMLKQLASARLATVKAPAR